MYKYLVGKYSEVKTEKKMEFFTKAESPNKHEN